MLLGAFILSIFTACKGTDSEKGNTDGNAINGHVSDDESYYSSEEHVNSRSDFADDLSEFFSRVESDVGDIFDGSEK